MSFNLSPLPVDRGARARRRLSEVVRIAGALVLATGLLALLGWQIDSTLLGNARPGFVSMKPNSAAAFVLAGLALLTGRRKRSRFRVTPPCSCRWQWRWSGW